ncbi:unnamed protein product [Ceutorhynchus assimilis]|uniref:Fibrinogen C-terminal domain-containing protein n=1 Tax=Ceutorhynchus assimilis TaxID=467358 RepID=A0A9N9MUX3_9CUCU|nr:unnamed protein product [Ceutorhynchus assimilis]
MSVCKMKILIFGLFLIGSCTVQGAYRERYRNLDQPSDNPQPDKCELKINQLKAHLDDKINALKLDIQKSRNVLQPTDNNAELHSNIGVILLSLKLLAADLESFGRNLTTIANTTSALQQQLQITDSIQNVFGKPSNTITPANCLEVKQKNPEAPSSIYLIQPTLSKDQFWVHCDMTGKNGGWVTIHHRSLGEEDFYRDWHDYKVGFGNVAGDYWLGLEYIHQLTGNQINELLIQLVDVDGVEKYARYSHFSIGSEEQGYALKVLNGYTGTAGDSLMYHAGSKFSTKDKDQDSWGEGSCAQSHGGAWWYKSCDKSNLNGRYLPGEHPDTLNYQSMYWDSFRGSNIGLKSARMLVRPRQEELMEDAFGDTSLRI